MHRAVSVTQARRSEQRPRAEVDDETLPSVAMATVGFVGLSGLAPREWVYEPTAGFRSLPLLSLPDPRRYPARAPRRSCGLLDVDVDTGSFHGLPIGQVGAGWQVGRAAPSTVHPSLPAAASLDGLDEVPDLEHSVPDASEQVADRPLRWASHSFAKGVHDE
jgi:hypothetical protein